MSYKTNSNIPINPLLVKVDLLIAHAVEEENAAATDAVREGEGAVEGDVHLIGCDSAKDETGTHI